MSICHMSYSSETAFVQVVNDSLNASDHGDVSLLVLLDFSGIDHVILCKQLLFWGVCFGTSPAAFSFYHSVRFIAASIILVGIIILSPLSCSEHFTGFKLQHA